MTQEGLRSPTCCLSSSSPSLSVFFTIHTAAFQSPSPWSPPPMASVRSTVRLPPLHLPPSTSASSISFSVDATVVASLSFAGAIAAPPHLPSSSPAFLLSPRTTPPPFASLHSASVTAPPPPPSPPPHLSHHPLPYSPPPFSFPARCRPGSILTCRRVCRCFPSPLLSSSPTSDASLPHRRCGVRRPSADPQPWRLLPSTIDPLSLLSKIHRANFLSLSIAVIISGLVYHHGPPPPQPPSFSPCPPSLLSVPFSPSAWPRPLSHRCCRHDLLRCSPPSCLLPHLRSSPVSVSVHCHAHRLNHRDPPLLLPLPCSSIPFSSYCPAFPPPSASFAIAERCCLPFPPLSTSSASISLPTSSPCPPFSSASIADHPAEHHRRLLPPPCRPR